MESFLFDTSVWVDFFRGIENDQTHFLEKCIKNDIPVFLCPTIVQEILQGIKSDKDYFRIFADLTSLEKLILDPYDVAIGGAILYRDLRKKGVTINKSNDCAIAYSCIKARITIVHNDGDFDLIAKHSDLKIYSFSDGK